MDTISRSRRAIEPRSGGKIVRARRTAGAKTPYERPRRNNPPPENPNWLSKLIFSPTRMITSGAGKLISSVFSADSSSGSSSSSSSSSSSGDYDSEDNTDDNCNNKEISTQGVINCFRKDAQPTIGKSETKSLIEQLVMQETFTREEYNKLTKIIESRVVDYCTTEDVENQRLTEMPNRTVGDNAILCSTAVMEARKWLTQKKLGSASKSDINHVTEDEGSSPVDMAKLYMKARPLWGSPSFKQELKSPSSISAQLFIEETPGSLGGTFVSSSKPKKDTPSIGSWNIQEEIQRVRSKATEEMLRTLPSKRIDWSGFGLENKSSPHAFMSGDRGANMGNKMQNSSESINASLHMATGKSTSHGFKVLEMAQDGLQIEASSPNQIITDPEQNQDLEAIQTKTIDGKGPDDGLVGTVDTEQRVKLSQDTKNLFLSDAAAAGVHGHKDTNDEVQHLSHMVEENLEDPRSHEENCSTSKEVARTRSHYKTNGFPTSSLSAEGFKEQNVILEDEEHNAVSSSHDKIVTDVFVDQTCELLSETSVEVPNNVNDSMNENDSVVDGSQSSLGMYNESSPSQTRANSKRRLAANTGGDGVEIQQRGKRLTRYNRRGRGRDK